MPCFDGLVQFAKPKSSLVHPGCGTRWAAEEGVVFKESFYPSLSLSLSFLLCVHTGKSLIYEANKFVNEFTALEHATPQTCWSETKRAARAGQSLLAQLIDTYTPVPQGSKASIQHASIHYRDEVNLSLEQRLHHTSLMPEPCSWNSTNHIKKGWLSN